MSHSQKSVMPLLRIILLAFFFIRKCDTIYYKLQQVLQSEMGNF